MARLITAQQLTEWARGAGDGKKYLIAEGSILTPGALDAARELGVQLLYPGPGSRALLEKLAKEVAGEPIRGEEIKVLESRLFANSHR